MAKVSEFTPAALRAVAAGKPAASEVVIDGGAKAIGKIVFTGNILAADTVTINGVAFTAKAVAAPAVGKIVFTGNIIAGDTVTINGVVFTATPDGEADTAAEFDVKGTLALSLASLATKLNASVNVLVSYATYTVTDTNSAITSTSDTNNSAHNDVVLASDHDSVVVTDPVGGVTTATATEFHVDSTLSLSLDNLATALNASANVLVSRATYTKTDTNTAITWTSDNYAAADDDVVLASTHSTVVITQPTGGADMVTLDGACEVSTITFGSAVTRDLYLPDGEVDGQDKTISMTGLGTANIISEDDLLPGTTNNYAMNGADVLILKWVSGKWRLILNDGATAS